MNHYQHRLVNYSFILVLSTMSLSFHVVFVSVILSFAFSAVISVVISIVIILSYCWHFCCHCVVFFSVPAVISGVIQESCSVLRVILDLSFCPSLPVPSRHLPPKIVGTEEGSHANDASSRNVTKKEAATTSK